MLKAKQKNMKIDQAPIRYFMFPKKQIYTFSK